MAREREIDVAQRGLELVEVEVLELERGREDHGAVVDPVRDVHQVRRVVLEQAPEERRLVLRVRRAPAPIATRMATIGGATRIAIGG